MILTGKAKEDFEKWLHSNDVLIKDGIYDDTYLTDVFEELPLSLQYSSIIEWLNSVGNLNHNGAVYNFKTLYLSTFKQLEKHHSILDIQKIAIKKANEIYNETTGK